LILRVEAQESRELLLLVSEICRNTWQGECASIENLSCLCSVGIYRVNYPHAMLDAMIPGIQDQSLSPQDRFNVQTDLYALARSNHINYIDYLKLLRQAYKHEDNLTVWKSIIDQLTDLNSIFDYASIANTKKLFQAYICDLLSNIWGKLQWDPLPNEGLQASMLRDLVLTQMGTNGHNRTCEEARKRFGNLFAGAQHNHQSINPNIRSAIYLTVAKTGNMETFEKLKSVGWVFRQAKFSRHHFSSIAKPIRKKNGSDC
jgi:aminopeptidase N